jgi:hypothetical protein
MLRQTELIHCSHLRVDDAKDEVNSQPLANDARAKATEIICVGKIGIAALGQLGLMRFGEKTVRQRSCIICAETRRIGPDWLQRSVQAPERRPIDTEMDVGRAGPLSDRQVLIDVSKWMRLRHADLFREFGGHGAEIIMRRGPRVNSKPSHYFPERREPLANALTFFLRKLTITGLSTFAAIFKTPSRNPASRSLPVDFLAFFRST